MKVLRRNLFLILIILNHSSYSQGRRNAWQIGYWQGGGTVFQMDFTGGSMTLIPQPGSTQINMFELNASICDVGGNMLFSTNGDFIADASGDTMMNGSGLIPGPFRDDYYEFGLPNLQGAIAIPFSTDSNKYFLFQMAVDYTTRNGDSLLFHVIDMSLNSGLGAVTLKNQFIIAGQFMQGEISAVKHGNGRDWWLFFHGQDNDSFYSYLIANDSLIGPFIQNIGIVKHDVGQAIFSSNGLKFASYDSYNDLELFDFDRCTGLLSNHIHISMPHLYVGAGCCFSPNSNLLYISDRQNLYQYNLQATNISASKDTVAVWDGFADPFANAFALSQLGSDGKIYIASFGGAQHMHVINHPDSLGIACDVQQHSIVLPCYNEASVPNLPFYELGAMGGTSCDSLPTNISSNTIHFTRYTLFPNPVRDILYIQNFSKEPLKSLAITDLLGKTIQSDFSILKNGEYIEVNTASLQQGLYILQMETDKGMWIQKFFKVQ
ncbi:MAG: T9SS type A sorting domain-containing protein [Bacteroidetes bacterium]|nr:T9SS type A sorting domain-containing protein [Bacteroidota bacterium]